MTVNDLILELSAMPPDAEVCVRNGYFLSLAMSVTAASPITQWRNLPVGGVGDAGPWRRDNYPEFTLNPDQERRPAVLLTTEDYE